MVVRRGGTRFEYLTLDLDPAGDAAADAAGIRW